jgi:hypothetical protein
MAQSHVHDLRGGLTPDVLESLRRADRGSLAIKDNRTAVLGFWIADELRVALIDAEPQLLQVRPGPTRSSPPSDHCMRRYLARCRCLRVLAKRSNKRLP